MVEKLGENLSDAGVAVSDKVNEASSRSEELVSESYAAILKYLQEKHEWNKLKKEFDLQPFVNKDSNVCWLCPAHAKVLNLPKFG
jgi:hypothetical protein